MLCDEKLINSSISKTAALAGLVASARVSGHIVVYLPDGDRLRKHGFYIEPCSYREGLYNLPEIAKEFCEQLLLSHGEDLKEMTVSREDMGKHLSEDQITRLFSRANVDDESASELSMDKILDVGVNSTSLSSGCYGMVISALMNQTTKPFTVVMDEFNCYYDHGHYFHMDYCENVSKAIPINKITIFKPFLDAMGLYPAVVGNDIAQDDGTDNYAPMKWGSMIVAMSESRAVRQTFTRALTESARLQSQNDSSFHVVDLRRFNEVEVQHILYNFECTGIGRLRFDRGYTTLNPEEVEYLRLVSGGLGQPLLDACMLP
jgi:small subunit ribosomal protein S29